MGGHFFDLMDEDVVFDFVFNTPGYQRHVERPPGRAKRYTDRTAT